MTEEDLSDPTYRRQLDEGLLVRWSTAGDAERLTALYGDVFRDRPDDGPNTRIGTWTLDMMSGRHPLIGPTDFAVVERTATGELVTATCLMSQVWDYEGIAIPVGRPETVATRLAYRRRGLVRAVFELIHARSAARGDLTQGITGIPYYYRQFGYEFALDLGHGRVLAAKDIPKSPSDSVEPYQLRDATALDLPRIVALYDRERAGAAISTVIDERYWRWLVEGAHRESAERWSVQMIVDASDAPVGYVAGESLRRGPGPQLFGLAVDSGVSLRVALPSVLRAVVRHAAGMPSLPEAPPVSVVSLRLGRRHPVYDLLGDALPPPRVAQYAWYVRVPDLPAFVRHIAPVLERRLAESACAGYTGEILASFYRGGLRLAFDSGRLTAAEEWSLPEWTRPSCRFPPLVFLQLLFGHRSLDELRHVFPDVTATDDAAPLLRALFPPRLAWVSALD